MRKAARWVLATHNEGKLVEFRALLDLPGFDLVPLIEFTAVGVDETGSTFVENAVLKARHAARISGLPVLADDSGLVVPALAGAPGVASARFAGPGAGDDDNIDLLLHRLSGVSGVDRAARFHCIVVALTSHKDPAPAIGHGIWNGFIAETRRGRGGFGYDPVFVDRDSGRTAAELVAAEKNAVSHRARAIAAIRPALRRLAGVG